MASLFTRIINGEIPCHKICEDENYFAFLEIRPINPGHTLVVPKKEVDYLFDADDECLGGMMVFAKKIAPAIEKAVECKRLGVMVTGLEVPGFLAIRLQALDALGKGPRQARVDVIVRHALERQDEVLRLHRARRPPVLARRVFPETRIAVVLHAGPEADAIRQAVRRDVRLGLVVGRQLRNDGTVLEEVIRVKTLENIGDETRGRRIAARHRIDRPYGRAVGIEAYDLAFVPRRLARLQQQKRRQRQADDHQRGYDVESLHGLFSGRANRRRKKKAAPILPER